MILDILLIGLFGLSAKAGVLDTELVKANPNEGCNPNTYVLVGCNICRCNQNGQIDWDHCTKKRCNIDDEVANGLAGRRTNEQSSCEPKTWYSLAPCQLCYCLSKDKLVCSTGNKHSTGDLYDKLELSNLVRCGKHLINDLLVLMTDEGQDAIQQGDKNNEEKEQVKQYPQPKVTDTEPQALRGPKSAEEDPLQQKSAEEDPLQPKSAEEDPLQQEDKRDSKKMQRRLRPNPNASAETLHEPESGVNMTDDPVQPVNNEAVATIKPQKQNINENSDNDEKDNYKDEGSAYESDYNGLALEDPKQTIATTESPKKMDFTGMALYSEEFVRDIPKAEDEKVVKKKTKKTKVKSDSKKRKGVKKDKKKNDLPKNRAAETNDVQNNDRPKVLNFEFSFRKSQGDN